MIVSSAIKLDRHAKKKKRGEIMSDNFNPRQFNDDMFSLLMSVIETGKTKTLIYAMPLRNYRITIEELPTELYRKDNSKGV
jgi:hypothetical protein